MTIQDAIRQVTRREDLSREDAASVMRVLMSGEATHAQMGALLAALHVKGESVDEITGFAETMRALATPIVTERSPLVDTCGTGGDHSGTFNISTASAFVTAGAGVAVAKHGNRSATSLCGSADVLEALGVNINAPPERVGRCIDEAGIGFLFARSLHGAMKHVAPVRSELGIRTVFNLLGPLTNPAKADAQVMGIFDVSRLEQIAEVLLRLGVRHAFVVAGADGLDEVTLSGVTHVAESLGGRVRRFEISPEEYGFASAPREALLGGAPGINAMLLREVLEGKQGPRRDVVVLNAALAIVAGRGAEELEEGVQRAVESLDSGAALNTLEQLIRLSHDS
ncbi:MAG TPA: anthranilate phosphoribosyltransferase [Candidatus Hydrogenedentes bacterium]|nr:anthranilate phosphoribosyltransferase [Candidatus Hydrogenedentota bacterium]